MPMKANRLEAFSDGVIAIIITIMVLEMKVPHEPDFGSLRAVFPVFLSYVLSFLLVAIYWVNHHQLLHLVKVVDAPTIWANMLLLFCMSLMPFATGYLGQSRAAPYATALYAAVALSAATSFYLLRHVISRQHRDHEALLNMHRKMLRKNLLAMGIYVAAIAVAFVWVPASLALVTLPAAMYFLPQRRELAIASTLHSKD